MRRIKRVLKTSALTRRQILVGAAAAGAVAATPPFDIVAPAIAKGGPLKVGVLAPLSGIMSSLGHNKVNGIKMFFGEKGNKVHGRPIELLIQDTEFKPQEAMREARKLVEEDNVDVLLGVLSSAIGYAMKSYAMRARKVWITTGAAADGIFKKANNTPYAFRSSLSTYQANQPMGTWLAKKGFKRAFVTGPDYAMGRQAIDAFDATFKVDGATTVGRAFAPLGTTDFAPYLADMKRANPDLVYASYAGSDAVRFVQQFNAFGLRKSITLAGYGYIVSEDLLKAEGAAAAGIYSGLNWAYGLDTAMNKAFVASWRKKFNAVPSVDSVAGYVGAHVVWEAFNKLGGNVTSQQALSNAVLQTKIDTPRGPISFDPATRNVIQDIYIREVVKLGGALHNKVIASYQHVRDPGT